MSKAFKRFSNLSASVKKAATGSGTPDESKKKDKTKAKKPSPLANQVQAPIAIAEEDDGEVSISTARLRHISLDLGPASLGLLPDSDDFDDLALAAASHSQSELDFGAASSSSVVGGGGTTVALASEGGESTMTGSVTILSPAPAPSILLSPRHDSSNDLGNIKSPTLSRLPDMPALAMVHDGSMKPTPPRSTSSASPSSPPPPASSHSSSAASSELSISQLPALPASPMPTLPSTTPIAAPAPSVTPDLQRSVSTHSASVSIARLASPPLSSSAATTRTMASSDVLTRLASPDLLHPPVSHPSGSTVVSTNAPTLVDHPIDTSSGSGGAYTDNSHAPDMYTDEDDDDEFGAAAQIDPAVLSQRILAEYCFNVAYVADWMNGDIPPPLGALEPAHKLTSAAAEKPTKDKRRRVPRIRLPGSKASLAAKEAKEAAAANEERRSRSPSFANAVPFAPLKVGPLAQHVMDLFDWEPYEDYQPVDVRMFFLHLKALLESLTSLTSGARSSTGLAASSPPRFLLADQFPSTDQLHLRIQHIIKAMRAEIALLADAHPELMQLSMEFVSSNARLMGPVAPADSSATSVSTSDIAAGALSDASLIGSAGAPRDWIRVLVPDSPLPLLQSLLATIQVQVLAADDQLPMDRKSKALLDRVCQLWRVSPVTKDALLTEWVVAALQSQPVATLWPCLVNRMDKTTITVRREMRTMAIDDQAAVRNLITSVVRQGKWYVSQASDDAVADLVHVLAVNKHLDAMIELMGLPATGQIVEAFAHGYTRRLLGLDLVGGSATDPGELMARLNHGAEQLPHFVSSLPLPDLQRNQIAFLLAHSFLMSASELCPIRLPDKEVREELTSVCYQHRRMRKVEDMMEDARAYLSEYAEEEMTLRRHSFTPDHLHHLEFLHELQLHLVSEKPEIEFVWDEWLLQLEDDLCDEVEVQIDEHLSMAAQAGAAAAAAAANSGAGGGGDDVDEMHRSRSSLGPTLEQLMDLLIKYLQYVQGFPFPNSHHVVRMIKALTRVFTRAITQGAQLSYRHILDGPHDRAALARGTLALQVRQLQNARNELGRVQRAVQAALDAIPDVSMDGYLAPFVGDEVMARIDVTEKPLGYALEVRAEGELLLTVEPKARGDSVAVPITHERTLELRLLAAADEAGLAAEPVQESSATVVVTLQHADHWETLTAFEDSDMPVTLQVMRDEQAYVKVYFQGCWDRITETIDSLMVVVADKVAQQILSIAKEYKKFIKTQARGGFLQQLQQSAANVVAPAQVAQVEASLTSLFDSVKNTLKRSNTQSNTSGSSSPTPGSSSISTSTSSPMSLSMLRSEEAALTRFRLAKMDDLNQYLAAVGKTIRDLEGPDRSGAALADQLRDGIWSTLSSRMAQHVLRNKAGDQLKERPLPYVEWLQSVLVRCRDTLFPVDDQLPQPTDDEGTLTTAQRAPAPQSYLLVLLSRYAMDTDELQQEYLSNIMSYLDFKSQRIAEQARLEAEEAAMAADQVALSSPTRQHFAAMSLNRTPGMSPPTSPPPIATGSMSLPRGGATTLRRAPTKVDPLLARITSDRQSVLFDKNLFKESPGTLQRRKTGGSSAAVPPPVPAVPHYNLSAASGGSPGATRTFIAPSENTVTRRPGALARIQAAQNRPLSVLARPPTMMAMHNGRYSIVHHPHHMQQPGHHAGNNRRNTMLMREPSLKSVAGSIAPSDPLHYPLFAVLSILRVRAESDPEIRTWLDEQKAVEQTIMTSMMQQEEEQRAAAAAAPSSTTMSRHASQDSYEPPVSSTPASSPPMDEVGPTEEKDMMVGGSMMRVGTISRPKRPR